MVGKTRVRRKKARGHDPLGKAVLAARMAPPQKRHKHGPEHEGDDFMDVTTDGFVPEAHSRKIFTYARRLQDEDEQEEAEAAAEAEGEGEGDEGDEEDVVLEFSDAVSQKSQFTDLCSMPDIEGALDPEDERILNELMPRSFVQTRNLADLIMEKIRQKEDRKAEEERSEAASHSPAGPSDGGSSRETKFDPKVVRVYRAVGKLLAKYKSGKIPKAMKVLPHLQQWEELLLLTKPHAWTPQAMYQLTRIFASTLNERMTQRFYNAVLLPSIRTHMRAAKAMPPHYYMSIRKAIFKQRAFLKGFLLPLCEDGDCNLREAMIIGSVLAKTSIKVVNAAVAMAKIALMPYNGACSLFLRVLIDKQFSLPLGCVDAIVQHFGAQLHPDAPKEFPVLWHQSLLSFVQRYKNDLTPEQVLLLQKVYNRHNHYLITSEIRRELMPILQRLTNAKAAKAPKR